MCRQAWTSTLLQLMLRGEWSPDERTGDSAAHIKDVGACIATTGLDVEVHQSAPAATSWHSTELLCIHWSYEKYLRSDCRLHVTE